MSLPTPEKAPWYQVSSADIVFLVMVAFVFNGSRQGMLDDPGLGWHLRNVDAMLEEGSWLTTDPFAGPRHGQPYYANQWLGEIPLWLGWHWAGLEGIAIVVAITLGLMYRYLYRMLMQDGAPWPTAVIWTALAALATSPSWVARPNLFTMLFILVTFRVLVLFHEGRCSRKATLWLWLLFAIWANVHGGFVAGLMMLVVSLVIETGLAAVDTSAEKRHEALGRAGHLVILSLGAAAATLCNPYGWKLAPWLVQLLGEPYFMDLHQEWRSPDFHGAGAFRFEVLMLLFPVLLAMSSRRANLVELGLSVMWLHFALQGFRYVALWVLVATPVMARCSLELPILQTLCRRLDPSGEQTAILAARPGPAPWVWTVVFAVLLAGAARATEGRFARHLPKYIPAAGLDRLVEIQREHPGAVVFHAYDWGGYLTWKGWPGLRTWIDDRNEVQGKEHIQEYFSIQAAEPGWEEKLDRSKVDLIAMFPGAPLTRELEKSGHWKEIYRDEQVVIFARLGPGSRRAN